MLTSSSPPACGFILGFALSPANRALALASASFLVASSLRTPSARISAGTASAGDGAGAGGVVHPGEDPSRVPPNARWIAAASAMVASPGAFPGIIPGVPGA